MSELLISVSKAERQEARMKVRQESLRLGNVGVIRYSILIKVLFIVSILLLGLVY